MSLSPVIAVRLAGLLAGLSLVAVIALETWRVPPSPQAAGVSAELRVVSSGEVGVQPASATVRGDALTPGGEPATAQVRLLNRTAGPVAVAPEVDGGDPALDGLLEVGMDVGDRTVFRGSLAQLRDRGPAIVTLPRGGAADVRVALRVPAAAGEDAVAQEGRWTLTFGAADEGPGR